MIILKHSFVRLFTGLMFGNHRYAIRESSLSKIKVFKNFKETRSLTSQFGAEGEAGPLLNIIRKTVTSQNIIIQVEPPYEVDLGITYRCCKFPSKQHQLH